MHSSLVRLQNVFGYFTTVAFTVGAAIALSSLVSFQDPSASLELRNVQVVKGRPHYYSSKKEEYAHVKFDLSADLSSLFSWNTKQVFVYVTATFPSQTRSGSGAAVSLPPSEAIIWDAIIPSAHSPWHPNTYIHPGTSNNPKRARRPSTKDKKSGKDTALPYPIGTTQGILKLSNQKPKYQITTPVSKIAGLENCTLHLRYNIQPWVGALVWSDWPASRPGKTGLLTPFWEGLRGSQSRVFAMPGLKGKVENKEELGTEKGAEAHRLMAG